MYQHPPTMICLGFLVLAIGILLCLFGSATRIEMVVYGLSVIPITGLGWMIFGAVRLCIAEHELAEAVKARIEKDRAREAAGTRNRTVDTGR